jgi:hypothetical protein
MTKGICKKVKHPDKEAADAVIRHHLARERRDPSKMRCGFFTAYKCSTCAAWHVGHKKHRNAIVHFIDKVMAADAARKKEYQTC